MKKTGNSRRARKRKRNLRIARNAFFVLLVVYLGGAAFFSRHFLLGTTVNGINASGKTVKKTENLIANGVDGYEIKIKPREGREEKITGSEINLEPAFQGILQEELEKQNEFFWPFSFFHNSKIEMETMVSFDKENLRKFAEALEVMDKSKMRNPKDAAISEYDEKKGYEIIPETEGTTIDEERFFKSLENAVLNLRESIVLEEEGCYTEPKYTKESQKIVKLAEMMNQYAKASVTYEFGESQEILDGKTISQWILVDKDQKASLSKEKIEGYVASLADKYNTAGKSKSLASSYGSTVTVSGGDYGWKIDQEKEAAALQSHIEKGETVSKEPAYSQRANSRGANDYGNTYVEVNLTAQHLYYYKNSVLVLETDFVSGDNAKGWSTPAGAYGLYYKEPDRVLRGEDYETPVSFWMPFNGGVGFHDANWRSDFGGNYYKRSGSHGCVNLPYSAAKKLYDNIEPGCAVLVYQLAGTESNKAKAQDAAEAVVRTIDALGEITVDSRGAVENARSQYNGLSEGAKGYVTNYNVLEEAESKMGQFDAEMALEQQSEEENQTVVEGGVIEPLEEDIEKQDNQ